MLFAHVNHPTNLHKMGMDVSPLFEHSDCLRRPMSMAPNPSLIMCCYYNASKTLKPPATFNHYMLLLIRSVSALPNPMLSPFLRLLLALVDKRLYRNALEFPLNQTKHVFFHADRLIFFVLFFAALFETRRGRSET